MEKVSTDGFFKAADREFEYIRKKIVSGKDCAMEIKETFTLLVEMYVAPLILGQVSNSPYNREIISFLQHIFNTQMIGIMEPIELDYEIKNGDLKISFRANLEKAGKTYQSSPFIPTSYLFPKTTFRPATTRSELEETLQ